MIVHSNPNKFHIESDGWILLRRKVESFFFSKKNLALRIPNAIAFVFLEKTFQMQFEFLISSYFFPKGFWEALISLWCVNAILKLVHLVLIAQSTSEKKRKKKNCIWNHNRIRGVPEPKIQRPGPARWKARKLKLSNLTCFLIIICIFVKNVRKCG